MVSANAAAALRAASLATAAASTVPRRLSGLQRQALSLYRSCLRAARAKGPDAAPALEAHARQEFEKYRRLEKREIQLIEHHLRRGSKQLELMRRPEFASVTVTAPPTR